MKLTSIMAGISSEVRHDYAYVELKSSFIPHTYSIARNTH
jgi:hypothetical protein